MKPMLTLILTVLALLLGAPGLQAEGSQPIQTFAEQSIAKWTALPVLLDAVRTQNQTTAALTEAQILDLDREWRAEVGQTAMPTISEFLAKPLSVFLAEQVASSDGQLVEVFVMDARGLNVAASDVTSDYWQGDEDKFLLTYGLGAGKTLVSPPEYDDSTHTLIGQVSQTITDPDTGQPIGAITLGMNALLF
ncbi:MAG: hypothetical protein JG765_1649 [Cereibacter sp.]|jgi:hypothetical protein|nr:hypothetical protein [Cereibacter sp.]